MLGWDMDQEEVSPRLGADEDATHISQSSQRLALEQAGDHPLPPQQRAVVDINDPAIQAEIRRQVALALLSISELRP
jgi:hypothetical protein